MGNFFFDKPKWFTKAESLDFKIVNQPLEEVVIQVISHLENESRKQNNFYLLLKGLLTTNFHTYKAICKLAGFPITKSTKYPVQAYILCRSIIDTLFTIVMLVEKPVEYSRKYELAGYRVDWEEYDRELKKYGNESEWQPYLDTKKKYLDISSKRYSLSQEEKANPSKHIDYWPIPSQMIRNKMVCDEKIKFLEEIYSFRYKQISEWSHFAWGGMAIGIFATLPEYQWQPGKLESDAVFTGILFILMILSEIVVSCNYSFEQKLRYIWTILKNYFEEAENYYRLRYDILLQKKK